jgi:hypothetical protein
VGDRLVAELDLGLLSSGDEPVHTFLGVLGERLLLSSVVTSFAGRLLLRWFLSGFSQLISLLLSLVKDAILLLVLAALSTQIPAA